MRLNSERREGNPDARGQFVFEDVLPGRYLAVLGVLPEDLKGMSLFLRDNILQPYTKSVKVNSNDSLSLRQLFIRKPCRKEEGVWAARVCFLLQDNHEYIWQGAHWLAEEPGCRTLH